MTRKNRGKGTFPDVIAEILLERCRQDEKWGTQDHSPMCWISVLSEEVGEAAEDANEHKWGPRSARRKNLLHFRQELIEVAAVAMAAVESIDRGQSKGRIVGWLLQKLTNRKE